MLAAPIFFKPSPNATKPAPAPAPNAETANIPGIPGTIITNPSAVGIRFKAPFKTLPVPIFSNPAASPFKLSPTCFPKFPVF